MEKEFNDLLQGIDENITLIHEYKIAEEITKVLNPKDNSLSPDQIAEHFAFNFVADYSNNSSSWGGYYGPLFVLPDDKGQMKEFPGRSFINEDVVSYWDKRSNETKNPILINRYADLVLDFGKSKNFEAAKKVIDTAIKIGEAKLQDPLDVKMKLKRALSLCFEYNNLSKFNELKIVIIKCDIEEVENNSPGLWGFAMKWLVLDNKKFPLSQNDTDILVASLQERIKSLNSGEISNIWPVECAAELLASYYGLKKEEDLLKGSLEIIESSYRKSDNFSADQITKGNYLENLISHYSKYSQYDFARKKVSELITEMGTIGSEKPMEMHEISAEVKIPQKEIDNYIESMFSDPSTEMIIGKIAIAHITKKDSAEKQLSELAQSNPLQFLCTKVVYSEYGFNIAKYGDINENHEQHNFPGYFFKSYF